MLRRGKFRLQCLRSLVLPPCRGRSDLTRDAPIHSGQDICSPSVVGYRPTDVMFEADGTQFEDYQEVVTFRLTRVMILHPVATGICFIAFLVSIGAGIVGSFLASLLAALAFLTTLLVLICDFVLWGIIKLEVDRNSAGSDAEFGVAIWCVLAAGICAFLAAIILFFSCCSARLRRRRDAARDAPKGDEKAAPTRKFWWNRSKA